MQETKKFSVFIYIPNFFLSGGIPYGHAAFASTSTSPIWSWFEMGNFLMTVNLPEKYFDLSSNQDSPIQFKGQYLCGVKLSGQACYFSH